MDLISKIIEGYDEDGNKGELIAQFEVVLSEEMIVGNVKLGNTGSLKIYIYPETTFRKPHVHIIGTNNTLPNGDAVVYLDKGMMWPHDTHQTILDKNQSKDFDRIMREPYKRNKEMTNWEFAVYYWNTNHPDVPVTIGSQPDYKNLYKNVDPTNQKKRR